MRAKLEFTRQRLKHGVAARRIQRGAADQQLLYWRPFAARQRIERRHGIG